MGRHTKLVLEILGKVLLLFVFGFAVIFAVLLAALIVAVVAHMAEGGSNDGGQLVLGGMEGFSRYVQPIGFIAAPLLMYLIFERKRGWPLGIKQPQMVPRLMEGMGWGAVLMTASFAVIGLVGGYHIHDWGVRSGEWEAIGGWFVLFIFVAVNEELLTRGYIQGLIRHHYGSWAAVVATSLLFASLHLANDNALQNPVPLLELFAAGVLLGVAREVSGGLWMPIGLHLTWNFFQGNIYGFAVSGEPVESLIRIEPRGPLWLSGGEFGAEGSLLALLVTMLGVWALYNRYTQSKKKIEKGDLPASF